MAKEILAIMFDGCVSKNKNTLYFIDIFGQTRDVTFEVCSEIIMKCDENDIISINDIFKRKTKYNGTDGTCNAVTCEKIFMLQLYKNNSKVSEVCLDFELPFDISTIELKYVDFTDLKLNKYRGTELVIADHINK